MNKKNNLSVIVKTLANLSGELSRSAVREIATNSGFAPEESHPLLKPTTRGNQRGHYSVEAMVSLGEALLNKTPKTKAVKVKAVKRVAVNKPKAAVRKPKSAFMDTINVDDEESTLVVDGTKSSGCYGFEPLAPTQDDIEDELSLMDTHM